MSSQTKAVVAFDLYDTLLSTASISKKLEPILDTNTAHSLSLLWRRYQLEYTWRLNSLGRFDSYYNITVNSLRHAAGDLQVELDQKQIDNLMTAYDSLSTFPDVEKALERIRSSSVLTAVIFSNGQKSMVENSGLRSADLGPQAATFDKIVTVDSVKKYKPTPDVYQYLAAQVGKAPHQLKDIWLVSGNPFDITGSKNAGLNAAWVERRSDCGWRPNGIC
ncbi:(S)-2-haloacid dehalogenase [Penicillium frequentans]|nr:(S)-2-haloacid dehalogenase [Penicillium glabrum]